VDELAIQSSIHALVYTMVQAAKKKKVEKDFRENITEELKFNQEHVDALTEVRREKNEEEKQ
jgi:hypothetical protein